LRGLIAFCLFVGAQSAPSHASELSMIVSSPSNGVRPGVPPSSAWTCPVSQPIQGNFTTYSGERCIYHISGGQFYGKSATGLFVARPLHPSFRDDAQLRTDWNTWLPQIRPHVTPDAGATPDMTPYTGSTFKKADLENIPARDLPFGVRSGWGRATWRGGPRRGRLRGSHSPQRVSVRLCISFSR
jgi:hypothetical protein